MKAAILVIFFLALFNHGQGYACDDQILGQQLRAKWQPQIEAASGRACDTARIMQAFLADTKNAISQCLHGKRLDESLAALDASIAQWGQTKSDVCR